MRAIRNVHVLLTQRVDPWIEVAYIVDYGKHDLIKNRAKYF